MRKARVGVALVAVSLSIVACSSHSTTGGGSNPGGSNNPAGCPAAAPASGSPCSPTGASCGYDCGTTATCSNGTWNVMQSNMSCADAGGVLPSPDAGGGMPGACSSSADCTPPQTCVSSNGCSACTTPVNPCATDDDCKNLVDGSASPMVCDQNPPHATCVCYPTGKTGECVPACDAPGGGCGPDTAVCDSNTGHCGPKPCKTDADCEATNNMDYACSSSSVCEPKPCKTDTDCPGHYCVNAICHGGVGTCMQPPG